MIKLGEFVNKFNGKFVEADGSQKGSDFYAQCVDIVKEWEIEIGCKRITRGNGNQLKLNADNVNYTWTTNTKTNYPRPGDLISFDVGKYGHEAVVLSANVRSVTVFEQNVPKAGPCRVATYNYINPKVLGWLHPHVLG